MGWDSNFARLATFTAKGTFRALKGKVTPTRYKALLSGAIAVLLEEHPGLDAKAARTRATKATGAKPAPEFLSTDGARRASGGASGGGGKGRRRSTAKATGTKAARSKTSPRKTTARKKTTRKARAGTTRRTTTTRKTTRRRKAA
ncbi:MAG: hypothetical protein ACYSXF_02530 [Planctomycetota bacterium]|jgi:hypothetical protein